MPAIPRQDNGKGTVLQRAELRVMENKNWSEASSYRALPGLRAGSCCNLYLGGLLRTIMNVYLAFFLQVSILALLTLLYCGISGMWGQTTFLISVEVSVTRGNMLESKWPRQLAEILDLEGDEVTYGTFGLLSLREGVSTFWMWEVNWLSAVCYSGVVIRAVHQIFYSLPSPW